MLSQLFVIHFVNEFNSKLSNSIIMAFPRISYIKNAKEEYNHSEEFIKETLEYIDNLELKNFPVIFSTVHLSILCGVKYPTFKAILNERLNFYKFYKISKKKGGFRDISSPHKELKTIQTWINTEILSKVTVSNYVYSFLPKKSIIDNAKVHLGQDYIVNVDLLNFFDSINEKRVYGIFKSLGYHPNLAVDLAKLCTVEKLADENISLQELEFNLEDFITDTIENENHTTGKESNESPSSEEKHLDSEDIFTSNKDNSLEISQSIGVLPQGGVTSPALSNIATRLLDQKLSSYANSNNLKYSRYADDITFSGKGENKIKLSMVERIIKSEGFQINKSKTTFYNSNSNKKIVTGLIVKDDVRLTKKFKTEVERHLHFCLKYGAESHIEYLKKRHNYDKNYFKEWLKGKICYVKMVEPIKGEELFKTFNAIDWGF